MGYVKQKDIEEQEEQDWDELHKQLEEMFHDAPFDISLVKNIKELDVKFCNEQLIIIKDDRAKWWRAWYGDDLDMTDAAIEQHINFTVVKAPPNGYITLRTILEAMIADTHYHKEIVKRDCHRFLESFEKTKSEIGYITYWGS